MSADSHNHGVPLARQIAAVRAEQAEVACDRLIRVAQDVGLAATAYREGLPTTVSKRDRLNTLLSEVDRMQAAICAVLDASSKES